MCHIIQSLQSWKQAFEGDNIKIDAGGTWWMGWMGWMVVMQMQWGCIMEGERGESSCWATRRGWVRYPKSFESEK